MIDSNSLAPQPLTPEGPTNDQPLPYRLSTYWLGRFFALLGDALIILAFFSPWIEVFKIAPGFSPTKHGYSPWMILQRGRMDALGVVTVAFLLLILGLLVTTCILASRALARIRADIVAVVTIALAFIGLFIVALVLGGASMSLSLNYPYYDTNIVYGGWLASVGFLIALVGSVFLSGLPQKWSPYDR